MGYETRAEKARKIASAMGTIMNQGNPKSITFTTYVDDNIDALKDSLPEPLPRGYWVEKTGRCRFVLRCK